MLVPMVIPLLTVTLIGVLVGTARGLAGRDRADSIGRAVVAAWVGFVAGAFVGVVFDVFLLIGTWVAGFGHLGALVAAWASTAGVYEARA